MTTPNPTHQLTQLSESLKATNALITRLARLSFQPGSEPLDSANTVRVELAQDIHDALRQLEEDVELLKQEVEDSTARRGPGRRRDSERDREGARLSAQVARLGDDLRHARSHFRRAQLTAKRASEAAKQKERELVFASLQTDDGDHTLIDGDLPSNTTPDLFAGRRRGPQQQKQLTKDELLAQSSSDVTTALRRTHSLLSTELSRSRFAQETFDQSTAALAELGEHYTSLDSVLSNSRNLLSTLLRSQKSDTWYLETAFYLLLATLGWLIFRRILYGPFVRLPIFLWNIFAFLANWVILRPLFFLLSVAGVLNTQPASGASTSLTITSSSRPPLIIQPSAKGRSVPFAMADQDGMMRGRGVPAGAGGAGAKLGPDPALQGRMSEAIAQMARQSEEQAASGGQATEELQRRGDGTVLRERGSDEPRNPKKKSFETNLEDAKHDARKRDEL